MKRSIEHARRVYQRHTRYFMFLAALVLVVVGGTGTALALSSQSAAPEAAPGGSQPRVFDRPQTSADVVPAAFGQQLQSEYASIGPAVANARRVTANDGQTAYLMPAQGGGVCFINTNESLCASSDHSAGAAAVDLCSPTLPLGQLEIEWLLPDGATNVALGMSNGTSTGFASGFNIYIARLPLNTQSPVPSTINWDSPGGQRSSVKAPIPSDAQTQSCMHPKAPLAGSARASGHHVAKIIVHRATLRR